MIKHFSVIIKRFSIVNYIPRIRRIGGCYGFTSKPPAARNGVNAITKKPRDGLFSNLVYTLVVIVSHSGMLMYPDDLCSAVIDNYGYYCLCVCLTVCWCFHLLGLVWWGEGRYTRVNVLYSSYTSLFDHIYIQNCTIFMSGVLDTYYSDHDAIFADIALHGYQQWVPQLTRSGLKGDLYVIFRH